MNQESDTATKKEQTLEESAHKTNHQTHSYLLVMMLGTLVLLLFFVGQEYFNRDESGKAGVNEVLPELDWSSQEENIFEPVLPAEIELETESVYVPSEYRGQPGYRGQPIDRVETDVYAYDHKSTDRHSRNYQFWGSWYFLVDDIVYYAQPNLNATSSAILSGVDAETFKLIGRDVQGALDYAADKNGIICDDHRADHIDPESFQLIIGKYNSTTRYSKDEGYVFYDCMVVPDADSSTFGFLKDDYMRDEDNLYIHGKKVENVDPEEATFFRSNMFFDQDNVYAGGVLKGSVLASIPKGLTGQLKVKNFYDDYYRGVLSIYYSSGGIDVVRDFILRREFLMAQNNEIYYISDDLQLEVFNIETGTKSSHDLSIIEQNAGAHTSGVLNINDMLLQDSKVYYLKGNNCNGHLERCNLDLYQYDLRTKSERLLASGFSSRNLLGVQKEQGLLYLSYADGDAGCGFQSFESCSLVDGSSKEVGRSSGCQGDNEHTSEVAEALYENEYVLDGVRPTDVLEFENGKLVIE